MNYEKGKMLIEYKNANQKDYVIEQLQKLGLKIEKTFKYIPYLAVECKSLSQGIEEKILSIEFEGEKLVEKIQKSGIIRAITNFEQCENENK